jgi:hypothetical protein
MALIRSGELAKILATRTKAAYEHAERTVAIHPDCTIPLELIGIGFALCDIAFPRNVVFAEHYEEFTAWFFLAADEKELLAMAKTWPEDK